MTKISIENRLKKIEERNNKVDIDKSWETSYFRKILLTLFTYLSIGIYLRYIKVQSPWLNAIVPALGFMLSTLTMPFFKRMWINHSINK